ncbi:MAG: hydrogenase maturation protease [Propionibacteriaceae bacterium]
MRPRILVAGVGNIFLGDDGFGPEVVRVLASAGSEPLPAGARLVDYGIRGMHLAYDLLGPPETTAGGNSCPYTALVLVDALPADGPDRGVRVLEVAADQVSGGNTDAHGMDPVAVLSTVKTMGGTLPPTYVVGVTPVDLDEGIGLSEPVQAAVQSAADAVRDLVVRLSTEEKVS